MCIPVVVRITDTCVCSGLQIDPVLSWHGYGRCSDNQCGVLPSAASSGNEKFRKTAPLCALH
jgi:hypothetical protein